MAAASLLLTAVFFTPLWRIDLFAPQYPEGLVMKIWHDHLSGDVDIINGLNHYIGMKHIKAEQFPEFGYLRYVVLFFMAVGLLVALMGRRVLLWAYLGFSALAGTVGLWDFYNWMYDYGHNLDPKAPILMPDGGFQPPLVGFKRVLNFDIYSMPDVGGWLIVGAGVVAAGLLFWELFFRKKAAPVSPKTPLKMMAAGLFGLLLWPGCASHEQPIKYGKDECAHCKMTIVEPRFAAEIVLKTGKTFKYDDLSCLLNHLKTDEIKHPEKAQIRVANHAKPDDIWLDAREAVYVKDDSFKSPMAGNMAAFPDGKAADAARPPGAMIFKWDDLFSEK